ncbi:Uncharacterized protein Fot_12715 [Forsythia ovata]|uniref:Uncharacterized protein n=1 Tax=Forsythia ovata TaxID=205694 RepID=A0ABD1W1P5_9LAMI
MKKTPVRAAGGVKRGGNGEKGQRRRVGRLVFCATTSPQHKSNSKYVIFSRFAAEDHRFTVESRLKITAPFPSTPERQIRFSKFTPPCSSKTFCLDLWPVVGPRKMFLGFEITFGNVIFCFDIAGVNYRSYGRCIARFKADKGSCCDSDRYGVFSFPTPPSDSSYT